MDTKLSSEDMKIIFGEDIGGSLYRMIRHKAKTTYKKKMNNLFRYINCYKINTIIGHMENNIAKKYTPSLWSQNKDIIIKKLREIQHENVKVINSKK